MTQEELIAALQPFARFYEVARHMGGPSDPMFHRVESCVGGVSELRALDYRLAFDLVQQAKEGAPLATAFGNLPTTENKS